MEVIHKFEIPPFDPGASSPPVKLPRGARTKHVAAFGGRVWLWAQVRPSAASEPRRIAFVATGQPVPEGSEYLGTGVDPDSLMVWHVFEQI